MYTWYDSVEMLVMAATAAAVTVAATTITADATDAATAMWSMI